MDDWLQKLNNPFNMSTFFGVSNDAQSNFGTTGDAAGSTGNTGSMGSNN